MLTAAAGLVQIGRGSAPAEMLPVTDEQWRTLAPSFAHLYVINKCHLRCSHCYESEETHPKREQLSTAELRRVLDDLKQLGVLVVTFSGGEPFLRRDLLELIAYAREQRFAVRIYTSGTHIDERKADRLAALGVSEVHVSLYSHDPAVHDAFTGVAGSHAKSVRALRLLGERGVATTLKATVLRCNVDKLDELVALAREVGTRIELAPQVFPRVSGDASPQAHAVPPEELSRKLFARADLSSLVAGSDAEGVCTGDGGWASEQLMCAAARRVITVGADGGVYACGLFPTAGGSVKRDSLVDVWRRSTLFDRIRKTRFGDMHECPTCEVRSTCNPCMAFGEIEGGDHRGCSSSSRHVAVAKRDRLERRRRAERRMNTGRSLPIVGELQPALPSMGTVLEPRGVL